MYRIREELQLVEFELEFNVKLNISKIWHSQDHKLNMYQHLTHLQPQHKQDQQQQQDHPIPPAQTPAIFQNK